MKWGDMTAGQWEEMQKFLVSQKLLEKPVPVDKLFTTALIDEANDFDLDAVLKLAASMN